MLRWIRLVQFLFLDCLKNGQKIPKDMKIKETIIVIYVAWAFGSLLFRIHSSQVKYIVVHMVFFSIRFHYVIWTCVWYVCVCSFIRSSFHFWSCVVCCASPVHFHSKMILYCNRIKRHLVRFGLNDDSLHVKCCWFGLLQPLRHVYVFKHTNIHLKYTFIPGTTHFRRKSKYYGTEKKIDGWK